MEDTELENEYQIIDFWRDNVPQGGNVCLPRLINGKTETFFLSLSEEAILFDAIYISKEHLNQMTNREVMEFIQAQSHTIH